jgi:hypothetical protein
VTLTVEDGTGLADAEAYISVTDADAYFAARGNAAWAALDTTTKEAALRKGADYMAGEYGQRWKGARVSASQALDWPRDGVSVGGYDLPDDAVPTAVARANAELAVRASAGDLVADEGAQVAQEAVGPISVTYAPGARQNTRYAAVDAMLASLLRGAGQVALVRA